MTRRFAVLVLVVAGGLAIAAPVGAKGPVSLAICGQDGCETVRGERRIERFMQRTVTFDASTTRVAPFYRLDMTIGAHGHRYTKRLYISAAVGTKLPASVRPFPEPTIVAVSLDGRAVTGDPATYLGLFSLPAAEYPAPTPADWVPVDLRSVEPSPWTDGRWDLAYSPEERVVRRGAWILALPDDLAEDIAAGRSLIAEDEGGGFGMASRLAVLAVIAGLAAALWVPARRRPLPEPAPPSDSDR